MPEVVDKIITGRSFETEQIFLRDAAKNPITREMIDALRREAASPHLTKKRLQTDIRRMLKDQQQEQDDDYDNLVLYVEFERGKMKTVQGEDAPKDFFKGISSSTDHAVLLAQRITRFMAEYRGR